ncbi:hypothetical protein POTOM_013384 [Populus tomentosa]|uniref:Uncharacterized protein n=1 Tax=Populus tomentosa TaxID=118781 RepID=A0A8X8A5T0_POPTO|nr:hypothetical protein POTOM_013384 [Populus tomentosa]
MANQGHNITYNANELTGQAQVKKDDFLNQCEEGYQFTQDNSYTAQVSTFLQQAIYMPTTSLSFVDWNQPSKSNEDEKDAIEGEEFDVEISVYDKPKYANEIIVISVD